MGDPVEGFVEQEHPAVPLLVVAEGCLEGEGCPAGAGSEGAGSEGADYDLSALLGAEPGPVAAAAAAAGDTAETAAEDTAVTADGHTAEAVAVESAQNTAAAVAAAAATAAFAAAHAAGAVDELTAVAAAALAAVAAAAHAAAAAAALTAADPAVEDAAVDSVVQYCSEHQPVVWKVETAMTAAPTVGPVAADSAPGVLVPALWVAVVGTGTGSGREE